MVAIVIPAHDEAATIGLTAGTAITAGVGPVVVVADKCSDNTADIAGVVGATVLEISAGDKGTAMAAGLELVKDSETLFLDADLIGLRPWHVRELGTVPPAGGLVVGLRDRWLSGSGLPPLSGERRAPTAFLRSLELAGLGYRAELAIDAAAARGGLEHRHMILTGVKNPSRSWRHPLMFADLAAYAAVHVIPLALYTEQSLNSG